MIEVGKKYQVRKMTRIVTRIDEVENGRVIHFIRPGKPPGMVTERDWRKWIEGGVAYDY